MKQTTHLELVQRTFQGKVMDAYYICVECQSRVGERREVLDFKFCPICGKEFV